VKRRFRATGFRHQGRKARPGARSRRRAGRGGTAPTRPSKLRAPEPV
ncbi:MAG: hypothetical protein AVDCRST_MAG22-2662, partial [uncultured Rubrobacteraceae bacterium]